MLGLESDADQGHRVGSAVTPPIKKQPAHGPFADCVRASPIYGLALAISGFAAPAMASALELSQTSAPVTRATCLEIVTIGAIGFSLVWFVVLTIVTIWDFCCGLRRARS
jgi:hypothetical protein